MTSYKKSFRISINIQSICFGYACTCFCRENTCDTAARSPARLLAAFFLDSISFRVVFPKRISARHCHAGAKEKGCSFCCQPFVSLKNHSCLQEWRSIPIWMERRALMQKVIILITIVLPSSHFDSRRLDGRFGKEAYNPLP